MTAHEGYDALRALLRREREARGWSRERVEDLTGGAITAATLKHLETGGHRRGPTPRTVRALAALYALDGEALRRRLGDGSDTAAGASPRRGEDGGPPR